MIDPLFIIDDQSHYLANSIRNRSPQYEQVLANLKASGLALGSHTEEGFLSHFFTRTATHVACLNVIGISELCGANLLETVKIHAQTRDKAPDRVVLFGYVNPLDGERALTEMDFQFHELHARIFKFYPNDSQGRPIGWWCDDPKVAYPIWEKLLELGIKVVCIHKLPLRNMANRWQDPSDVDTASASFPKLNFVVYHAGYPAVEKVAMMCGTRPNVYADLGAPLIPAMIERPQFFSDQVCRFLVEAPATKLCWGTDMMVVPGGEENEFIETFWDWQVPEKYQEGYGIRPLTDDQKRQIMGGNFASFLGIDPKSHLNKIQHDEYSGMQSAKVRNFLARVCPPK